MLRFRVWDTHKRQFLSGYKELLKYFHGFCNSDDPTHMGLSFWDIPDKYFLIFRSMDKKDKNGRRLYDGDIVKDSTWYSNKLDKELPCLYMYYYDTQRTLWLCIPLQPVLFTIFKVEDSEYVGHKLSHPELLKHVTEEMIQAFKEDRNI